MQLIGDKSKDRKSREIRSDKGSVPQFEFQRTNIHSSSQLKKRRSENVGVFLKNLVFRNIINLHTAKRFLILVVAVTIVAGGLLLATFKNRNVKVNRLNYLDQKQIEEEVKNITLSKPVFFVSQKEISSDLKKHHSIIQDAYVNKSFLLGLVVEIKEYEPKLTVKTADRKEYFVTTQNKVIPFDETVQMKFQVLNYENDIQTLNDRVEYVDKSVQFIKKLNNIGIQGDYSFDLFGNLSILTLDNKTIKVDLKERYFKVDEQVKILEATMKTEDYKMNNLIDLRFNYLLVKKVP